jgi:hypothetical protein
VLINACLLLFRVQIMALSSPTIHLLRMSCISLDASEMKQSLEVVWQLQPFSGGWLSLCYEVEGRFCAACTVRYSLR